MAKKVRLDFTKVEERSGWNTREIPEGLHEMKVAGVEITEANDGTDMWVYALVPTNDRYKARRFPYYCKLQPNQLWKVRDLLVAAGISVPKKAVSIDPEQPVGKIVAVEVADSTNPQYPGRSEVNGIYDSSIIEEDSSEDDDDEDYDDSEADEEEYDEEDEEGLREELEALTLAQLRKRAKGLGIDTDGVKKADLVDLIIEEEEGEGDEEDDDFDEDDLGDEDLDDEEFDDDDDEEEEPEPTPRRTAKKGAAKAAPARRTVRRR